MQPTEYPKFREMLAAAFETLNRRPPTDAAFSNWLHQLRDRSLGDIQRALDEWLRGSAFPPTPANVRELIEARNPKRVEGARVVIAPSPTTLMAARITLERHGESECRRVYGDEVAGALLTDQGGAKRVLP